jgi:hypothetical protein
MRPADCDLDIRGIRHPCLFCLHAFWSLSLSWPTYVPSICRNYSCTNLGLRVPCILNKRCVHFAIWTFWTLSQNFERHRLASSCLSVCPSVRLSVHMEQLGCHYTDFHEIACFEYFKKIYWENSSLTKIRQELQVLYIKTYTHFRSHLS